VASCPDCEAEVSVWARQCGECGRQLDWPQPAGEPEEGPAEEPGGAVGQPAGQSGQSVIAPAGPSPLAADARSPLDRPEPVARCRSCDSVVPGGASWCPSCGWRLGPDVPLTMTRASSEVARTHGTIVQWATRRRLVLSVVAAAGALILIAQVPGHHVAHGQQPTARRPASAANARDHVTATTTGTALAATPASSTSTTVAPPMLPHKTGTVLLLASGARLSEVDLDGNSTRSMDLPQAASGNFANFGQGPGPGTRVLIARGRFAVFQAGNETLAVPADLSRPPVVLGRSVTFIPSLSLDRVWLLGLTAGTPTVREVEVTGRVTSPTVDLPIDWVPQAAVENGLLLSNGVTYEVWDPRGSRIVRSAPPAAQIVASSGRLVVWSPGYNCQALCALHISDVIQGTDHAIYPQTGPYYFAGAFSGAFSPDGRVLALGLNSSGDPSSPGGLLLVDTSTYSTTLVSIDAASSSTMVWAPSGRWLFFLNQGNGPTLVEAYHLGATSADIVNLPSTVGGTAFAAF
jgi:Double zinc ribbon